MKTDKMTDFQELNRRLKREREEFCIAQWWADKVVFPLLMLGARLLYPVAVTAVFFVAVHFIKKYW